MAEPVLARFGSLAVAAIGLAVSTYLTVEHYTASSTLACPDTGAINCAKVTTSAWSHVGPVPVALLGALYFLVMSAACVPAAWRSPLLATPRIAASAVGVAVVLYLIWVELFRVNAICLWCTATHVCAIALFAVVLWASQSEHR